jgi:hypothetical protein
MTLVYLVCWNFLLALHVETETPGELKAKVGNKEAGADDV